MKKYFTLPIIGATIYGFAIANSTTLVKDYAKLIGEKISICGKVTGSKGPVSNTAKSTIIQVTDIENASSTNIVIRQEDRKNFGYKPEEYLYNKNVCIVGIVGDTFGRTELFVRRPDDIKIEETAGNGEIRPFDFDGFNRFMQD